MININKYLPEAGFPNGEPYSEWMKMLATLVGQVGAKLLWKVPVLGQPGGMQSADEILGARYPSHKSFLSLRDQPASEESFRDKKSNPIRSDLIGSDPIRSDPIRSDTIRSDRI